MIRVVRLTKRYGPTLAVDNISFDVAEGEIVGFLGPNGAGKSSTIRILTCYQPATSGSASVAGFDVFNHSMEVRRRIGYLPENTPLYPEMRVNEYLNFRGKLHGLSHKERGQAIARVSDRCWLGDFVTRPIGQLSKGMRQRVGLADALLHDPKVLFLDEPTIGLDPTQIRETRNLIQELGEHHTIVFSSHILSEVEQVCTRAIIIAGGRIRASGTPAELRERVSADSKFIAEIKGPADQIEKSIKGLDGVDKVDMRANDGWNRLAIDAGSRLDIGERLFKLTADNGWALREMRREVASLEDFFVKITAQQRETPQ